MTDTVTVTRVRKGRVTLSFSKLPGEVFGPWSLTEAIHDLRISALLEPVDARNLVFDAMTDGSATTETR